MRYRAARVTMPPNIIPIAEEANSAFMAVKERGNRLGVDADSVRSLQASAAAIANN
jgi:hypothetical protein